MSDPYEIEREGMVKDQLKRRGLRNLRLLAVFRKVPRHEFVPANLRSRAYQDGPLPIGQEQTISQPYMVALMTQAVEAKAGDRVLEIGTGSGYQTAVLAELGATVFTVERIPELVGLAEERLERLDYRDIHTRVADGTLGWEEEAPFDAIIVTAGAPEIPQPLLAQLVDGGRLAIPLEEGVSQVLYVVRRSNTGFKKKRGEPCSFVPLIGEYGWKRDPRVH